MSMTIQNNHHLNQQNASQRNVYQRNINQRNANQRNINQQNTNQRNINQRNANQRNINQQNTNQNVFSAQERNRTAASQMSPELRLQQAQNNAAGHAIYEKMGAVEKGLEQGIYNAITMNNLLTTAGGDLSSISGDLLRIQELSMQASNNALTDSDRSIIQGRVNQLLQGIGSVSNRAQFNNIQLLNGTFANKHVASGLNGTGQTLSIGSMSPSALGIQGYNVTGQFNIGTIGQAISTVNSAQSALGATSNRLNHTVNANAIAHLNIASTRSRLADTNFAATSTASAQNRTRAQYQSMMKKADIRQARSQLNALI